MTVQNDIKDAQYYQIKECDDYMINQNGKVLCVKSMSILSPSQIKRPVRDNFGKQVGEYELDVVMMNKNNQNKKLFQIYKLLGETFLQYDQIPKEKLDFRLKDITKSQYDLNNIEPIDSSKFNKIKYCKDSYLVEQIPADSYLIQNYHGHQLQYDLYVSRKERKAFQKISDTQFRFLPEKTQKTTMNGKDYFSQCIRVMTKDNTPTTISWMENFDRLRAEIFRLAQILLDAQRPAENDTERRAHIKQTKIDHIQRQKGKIVDQINEAIHLGLTYDQIDDKIKEIREGKQKDFLKFELPIQQIQQHQQLLLELNERAERENINRTIDQEPENIISKIINDPQSRCTDVIIRNPNQDDIQRVNQQFIIDGLEISKNNITYEFTFEEIYNKSQHTEQCKQYLIDALTKAYQKIDVPTEDDPQVDYIIRQINKIHCGVNYHRNYNNAAEAITATVDDFFESLHLQYEVEDKYLEENYATKSLHIQQIVKYKVGEHYEKDEAFESRMKNLLLVKNTDRNCLYAALFLGLLYYSKVGDKFIINNKAWSEEQLVFSKHTLEREMQNYSENTKCKNGNLFTNTRKMKELLCQDQQQQNEEQIIQEFSKQFKIGVVIVTYSTKAYKDLEILKSQQKIDYENVIFLLRRMSHYSVIRSINATLSQMYNTPLNFCIECEHVKDQKGCKCGEKYFCSYCQHYHSRNFKVNSSNEQKIWTTCDKCHFQKYQLENDDEEKKCQQNHEKICHNFEFCNYCQRIHNKNTICSSKIDYEKTHFKTPNVPIKDENDIKKVNNFMVFDIESYYETNLSQEERDRKFTARHVPFLICFLVCKWNYETKKYDLIHYKNDYVLGVDPYCEFLQIVRECIQDYNIKFVFSHNGGKYDNILLLSYLIKNYKKYSTDDKINYSTVFNNGVLLDLKFTFDIGEIHFRDSCRLIATKIEKFSKQIINKDTMIEYNFQTLQKFKQSYTFLTKEMLDQYLQNNGVYLTIGQLADKKLLTKKDFEGKIETDEEFKNYVEENRDKNFIEQYIVYCKQDVNILALGLIQMDRMSMQCDNVFLTDFMTCSQMAYQLYLNSSKSSNFEQYIYNTDYNRSLAEQKLILYIQHTQQLPQLKNMKLQVVGAQVQFDQYNIDIVVENEQHQKFIVEVDGVYYHGLINLQPDDKYYKLMCERKAHHIKKSNYLIENYKEKGYKGIVHITDLEVNKLVNDHNEKVSLILDSSDEKIQKELDKNIVILGSFSNGNYKENGLEKVENQNVPMQFQIQDRDIFRGGRTEYYYNYAKWDPKKYCLKGFDITSEYPGAMLQNLPLGGQIQGCDVKYIEKLIKYAESITDEKAEDRMTKYFKGCDERQRIIQAQVAILPPQNLQHPVLCVKINNKFLSPLCRKCAEEQCKNLSNNTKCEHTEEERMIYGYFDEVELIHAINLGYKICKVFKTVLWCNTSFNTPSYHGQKFIQNQMFQKSLASDPGDYNKEVLDNLKEQGVIDDYKIQDQDIYLKRGEIEQKVVSNAALKSYQKINLNSTYGKTGQNKIRKCQEIVDYDQLLKIYKSRIDDFTFQICGNNIYSVSYTQPQEIQILQKSSSNEALAGRITALSRTVLYTLQLKIQQQYQGRILYSDTDSAYALVPIKYDYVKGMSIKNTFGVKTEEKIQEADEFVCIAPKQYSYKNTDKNQTHQTNKGISVVNENQVLDDKGQHLVLHDVYKQLVFDNSKIIMAQQNKCFVIDEKTKNIYKRDQLKQIRIGERKRLSQKLITEGDGTFINTLPFGFKE